MPELPREVLDYYRAGLEQRRLDTGFHRADELRGELTEAGLTVKGVLGIEGPGWLLSDFDRRWADAAARGRILAAARSVEAEPTMLGVSPHLLAVARGRG